jgi:hypothetical protein
MINVRITNPLTLAPAYRQVGSPTRGEGTKARSLRFWSLFGYWKLGFCACLTLSKLTHNSSKIKQYFIGSNISNSSCLLNLYDLW